MILSKALVGISDCPDYAVLYIFLTAYIIDDVPRHRIHEEGVDGEVAAAHIPICARKFDMRGSAPVLIATLGSKCGDFITVILLKHDNDAKSYTNRYRMREERTDIYGPCSGNNVIISRRHAAQKITHTSTHKVGFITGISQSTNYARRLIARRLGFSRTIS